GVARTAVALPSHPVPIQFPIGAGAAFSVVVDLVEMKAYEFEEAGDDKTENEVPIPASVKEAVDVARAELGEKVSELDDALMEKFVEGEAITNDEIRKTLRSGVLARRVQPVLCGSALKKKGVRFLLDAIVEYLPSPLDLGGGEGRHPH